MKLAKKLLAVALAGVMAVSMLAGCSGGDVQKSRGNALKNALNDAAKKNTEFAAGAVNYSHDSSLDSVASGAYTYVTSRLSETLAEATQRTTSAGLVMPYTDKYAYAVLDLKTSESKNLKNKSNLDATKLDKAIQHSLATANHTPSVQHGYIGNSPYWIVKGSDKTAGTAANPAKVSFGVQYYSEKDSSGKDNYYAVVVVETVPASTVQS